jgi:hypothetical protein
MLDPIHVSILCANYGVREAYVQVLRGDIETTEAKREEKNRNDAEKVKSLKGKQSNDAFVDVKVNRAELDPVRHADRDAVDLGANTRGEIVLEWGIRLPVCLHLGILPFKCQFVNHFC